MSVKAESIPRPDMGLHDPNYRGNPKLSVALKILLLLTFLSYSFYLVVTLIEIFKSSPTSIILNLMTLFVEAMIGYYSMILFWHLSRIFDPVKAEPQPILLLSDLKSGNVPTVSVLLSCFKEPLSIVEQSVRAALDLNYPAERYEVVVFEDGRENEEIEQFCNSVGARYLTRSNRENFKAGAVNEALPLLTGDYVLFIDADHILERNIIINCLRSWRKDTIGVQTRVDFVNLVTYLTTVSGFLQIQFFSLMERGRRASGSAVFAGGGALFDRHLLMQEGGMQTLTIADDTDTSFYLKMQGYRIEYIDVIGVWALVPWDPLHQIRQVWRWMTGITRSFRSRGISILTRNKQGFVRFDHFSTAFYPVLGLIGWFMIFIFALMVQSDVPVIRGIDQSWLSYLSYLPLLVNSLAVITGTLALMLDDKIISYRQKPLYHQIATLSGFYLLVIAAQPLLIGAIIKGLTGFHVEFNRTPKKKDTVDENIDRIKLQYLIYTLFIFALALIFTYFAMQIPIGDGRQIPLLLGAYSGIMPLIIALLWYWKLEGYLNEVGETSALKFLEEMAQTS